MLKAITSNCSPLTNAPWLPGTRPSARPRKPFRVTTSWDDGSPHDLRLADLLARYGLPGTFYLPRASQRPTMGGGDVRRLAAAFDVGGHTLDHLPLTELPGDEARRQIAGSKAWLEDLTGRPCASFCPPLGKFRREHAGMIRAAGFAAMRTVELLSLDAPRPRAGLLVLPTTLQAYPHRGSAYLKNSLRRGAPGNFWRYCLHGKSGDWVGTCRAVLEAALERGGVFHLWGHAWEIEETGQWGPLEQVLRMLASCTDERSRMTNSELALHPVAEVG